MAGAPRQPRADRRIVRGPCVLLAAGWLAAPRRPDAEQRRCRRRRAPGRRRASGRARRGAAAPRRRTGARRRHRSGSLARGARAALDRATAGRRPPRRIEAAPEAGMRPSASAQLAHRARSGARAARRRAAPARRAPAGDRRRRRPSAGRWRPYSPPRSAACGRIKRAAAVPTAPSTCQCARRCRRQSDRRAALELLKCRTPRASPADRLIEPESDNAEFYARVAQARCRSTRTPGPRRGSRQPARCQGRRRA